MYSIKYQVVGEEDYAFEVKIRSTGEYEVNSGTYTTQPPRRGTLTEEQEVDLLAASRRLESRMSILCLRVEMLLKHI